MGQVERARGRVDLPPGRGPGAGTPGPDDDPGAGEYLTGDLNLIHARAVVQYRVADPAKFVLAADDREAILGRLAEASLAQALSRRGVDGALRDGRARSPPTCGRRSNDRRATTVSAWPCSA